MKDILRGRILGFDNELQAGRERLAALAQEMERIRTLVQRIEGARAFAVDMMSAVLEAETKTGRDTEA